MLKTILSQNTKAEIAVYNSEDKKTIVVDTVDRTGDNTIVSLNAKEAWELAQALLEAVVEAYDEA